MMRKTLLSISVAMLAGVVCADDFNVEAPVQKAILYQDSAEVVRHLQLEIPTTGHHRIIVEHSLTKDASKLRPVIQGAVLQGVSTQINRSAQPSLLDEDIAQLNVQLRINKHEMSVNNALVKGLSESLSKQADYHEVQTQMQHLNTAYANLIEDRISLQRKLDRLRTEKKELSGANNGLNNMLVFDIDVAKAGKVDITWQVYTNDAYWQPSTDWMLNSKDNTLSMSAHAKIIQKTGVDWAGTSVTLAIVPPQYVAQPYLETQTVSAVESTKQRPLQIAAIQMEKDAAPNNTKYMAASEPVIAASGLDFMVKLPGQYDLPSGITGRAINYWQGKIDAEVYSAVYDWAWPRNTALLMAQWEAPKALNILLGNMTLYRDGNLMTQIDESALMNAGSKQTLSFGVDPQLSVRISNPPGYTENHGLINKSHALSQRAMIEVTNHSQQSKEVRIFSHLPVSTQEDVEVSAEWLPKPSEQNADGIKGLTMWKKVLAPEDNVKIETGYDINYPEGTQLIGL